MKRLSITYSTQDGSFPTTLDLFPLLFLWGPGACFSKTENFSGTRKRPRLLRNRPTAPVAQSTHRINHHPMDNSRGCGGIHPINTTIHLFNQRRCRICSFLSKKPTLPFEPQPWHLKPRDLTVKPIRPCHKAAILPRGTKKALFYQAKPHPHGFHCEV